MKEQTPTIEFMNSGEMFWGAQDNDHQVVPSCKYLATVANSY